MNTEPPTGDDLQRMLVSMKHHVLEHAEDRRPARRRHRPGIVVAAVALLALGTASGAVALAVVPQQQTAAPTASAAPPTPRPTTTTSSAPVIETPAPHPTASSGAAPARYPNDCRALYSDADRERFFGRTPLTQTPAHPDGTTAPTSAPVPYAGDTWTASTWLDCTWHDPQSDVSNVRVTLGSASDEQISRRQDLLRAAGGSCRTEDVGEVCTHTAPADPYPVDATETFWSQDGRWIDVDQVNVPTSGLLDATIDGVRARTTGEATNGPGTWLVSGAGVGPVTIGGSFRDAAAAVGAVLPETTENCPNPNVAFFGSADVQVVVMQEDGRVVGVEAAGPTTATGLGVGDTVAELRAAYPGLVRLPGADESSDAFALWTSSDGDGSVTFEMDEDGRFTTGVWVGADPRPPYEYCN